MTQDTFRALGVSEPVAEALEARGFSAPFRIQAIVLPDALAGHDVLGKAPTGSGKTLAFALPIVEQLTARDHTPSALVLVPTRELALQVTEELAAVGKPKALQVATVYGGAPLGPQAKRARDAHVLVATPGRMFDLMERKLVDLEHVRVLVLDEADRMLDMGFKPQVDRIVRRLPAARQTMLFSATLDGEVNELATAYTDHPARFEAELAHEQAPGEIDHRFVSVSASNKVDVLIEELESERGLALIFVRTKRGADRLAQRLRARGIEVGVIHGDLSQRAREKSLDRFRSGRVTALIGTDVAARGLDLSDITHVINFDPPEDDKGYVHRIGRTGRAGRSGNGVTLVLPEQQADVSRVAVRLGHREQFEESGLEVARPRKVYTSRRGRNSRW